MQEKNYTGLIPGQEEGVIIDSEASEAFETEEEAKSLYQVAKSRLLEVNRWNEVAGVGSANFQLVDQNGQEVNRKVEKGDYFKIDIPGPGSTAGDGYDWVQVEELQEVSQAGVESIAVRVRPSQNPFTDDESIAHFYSKDSTSTFTVTREKSKVTAVIYDRNTKPNTETATVVDKVRDVAAGLGAILGGSKLQWKGLAKGLVKK